MERLRIASCQINPTVGDLDGNVAAILAALDQAEAAGADLAIFGELAICGYPPEDLLLKPRFIADCRAALDKIAARTGGCAVVVGFPDADRDLYNAAALCADGSVLAVYHKQHLPNYAVFDEQRYFTSGRDDNGGDEPLVSVAGINVGLSICEDSWVPFGPIGEQAAAGAELVVNINGSPYRQGKAAERERMLSTRAADASCAIVWTNQVGGQDELVFDGGSCVINPDGQVVARSPQFCEHILVHDLELRPQWRKRQLDPRGRPRPPLRPVVEVPLAVPPAPRDVVAGTLTPLQSGDEEVYNALVTGVRDYVAKNGFTDVVLGLSGGIDSTLCTVIAADAVGADQVHAVALPSRYSTDHSITDAEALCSNLGVKLSQIAIEPAFAPMLDMLAPAFDGHDPDVTEENLQGRIRAALLMALANKFRRWLVLVCGNKSELAVGYTTIYGVDMAGGFAPIRDVPKTLVYRLARWRNTQGDRPVIPDAVITKPPSAELAPDQLDADNLPPYDVLDPILERYVEDDWTAAEIIEAGYDEDLVRRITRLVDVAEWKRRQAPTGPRVTTKAFGKDRRLPITNAYR